MQSGFSVCRRFFQESIFKHKILTLGTFKLKVNDQINDRIRENRIRSRK